MSTLKTDVLKDVAETVTVNVVDIPAGLAAGGILRTDLANAIDPTKGAALIGYSSSTVAASLKLLSRDSVNSIWNFENLVVSKPNPLDPETWDWSPALQGALNAGAGHVYFPGDLTYTLVATIDFPDQSFSVISGDGPQTKLINNTGDMFKIDKSWVGVIRDLTLETGATAGHVWLFTTKAVGVNFAGIANSRFSNLRIYVKNPVKSVMSNSGVNALYIDNLFDNFTIFMTIGHTAHAFDFQTTDGGVVGANRWSRGRITYGTVHSFMFATSNAGSYLFDNILEDINFEVVSGGMVKGLGVQNLTLISLYLYDVNVTGTVNDHSIYLGKLPGGVLSRFVSIRNCQRRSSTLNTGIYDIFMETGTTTQNVIIDNCNNATASGYKIDLGLNSEIWLVGLRTNTVVDNKASSVMYMKSENSRAVLQLGLAKAYFAGAVPDNTAYPGTGGEVAIFPNTSEAGAGLWLHDGTAGYLAVQTNITKTTAEMSSATNTINTVGKVTGKMVWNSTLVKPLWASGGAATSIWRDATGAAVITPA